MIDMALVRQHLKMDEGNDDEEALVEHYLASAVKIAEGYIHSRIVASDSARQAEIDSLRLRLGALRDDIQAELDRDDDDTTVLDSLRTMERRTRAQLHAVIDAIELDPAISAAILLILSHLYRNRQDSAEIPQRAADILNPYIVYGSMFYDW